MNRLKGKVALVTGAARGLGREYALRLASLGADVGVIDINLMSHKEFEREKLDNKYETVVDVLKEFNINAYGVEVDISNEEEVKQAFNEIKNNLGEIDILVANAGGGTGLLTENLASSIDSEQLEIVMARNFYGTLYSVKNVVESMKQRRTGKIITVTSVAGLKANSEGNYAHYSAAKAAIVSFTKNLARELGEYNITANAIAPGYISTGRLSEQFEKAGAVEFKNQTALKRFGTPKECADVIEFLATDLSDYVTGTVIDVTGGLMN